MELHPLSNARVNDPSTWADYISACEVVERRPDVDGIGFTLTDTPYAAFDLVTDRREWKAASNATWSAQYELQTAEPGVKRPTFLGRPIATV